MAEGDNIVHGPNEIRISKLIQLPKNLSDSEK